MAQHNALGSLGEQKAVEFLQAKGYQILDTNWRNGRYELDIIAMCEDEMIFVEVKTRSEKALKAPEDSVDRKKIRHIVTAANKYVRSSPLNLSVRFDIIAIIGDEIEHIEEAFYPPVSTKSHNR